MDGLAAASSSSPTPYTEAGEQIQRPYLRHYSDFVQDDKLGALDPESNRSYGTSKARPFGFNWLPSVWIMRNSCVFSL